MLVSLYTMLVSHDIEAHSSLYGSSFYDAGFSLHDAHISLYGAVILLYDVQF